MKSIKVIYIVLFGIALLLASVSCNRPAQNPQSAAPSVSETPAPSAAAPSVAQSVAEGGVCALPGASADGQILLQYEGITVTYLSVSYDGLKGPAVNVSVENNSDKAITVEVRDFTVNSSMIDPVFSSEAAPGEKKGGAMVFSKEEFTAAGITEIRGVEFSIELIDTKTGEYIVITDPIVLNLDG